MKIALGTDHEGYEYKEQIKQYLAENGHEVLDFGSDSADPCDYPDFVGPAAEAVGAGECDRAIVLGASGNGEAIVANKIRGIRCTLCWNERTARFGRAHNDANVLSLGAHTISLQQAIGIVEIWLATPFEGGRHARRIDKITALENHQSPAATTK